MSSLDKAEDAQAPASVPSRDTRLRVAYVVGDDELHDREFGLGRLVKIIDLFAGAISAVHAQGPVATVCIDRVTLQPGVTVVHGDFVEFVGQVIRVGSSSMLIEIVATKHDTLSGEKLMAVRTYVTMVAIDPETLRPRKGLTKVHFGKGSDRSKVTAHLKSMAQMRSNWQHINERLDRRYAEGNVRPSDVRAWHESEDEMGSGGKGGSSSSSSSSSTAMPRISVPVANTRIVFSHQNLPRSQNNNGTVFGGDHVFELAKIARHTAARFCGTQRVRVVAFNSLVFKQPLRTVDMVQTEAHVVYVRRHTVNVHLTVRKYGPDDDHWSVSHTGLFVVGTFDSTGRPQRVTRKLDLTHATQQQLRWFEESDHAYRFWLKYRGLFDSSSLDLGQDADDNAGGSGSGGGSGASHDATPLLRAKL